MRRAAAILVLAFASCRQAESPPLLEHLIEAGEFRPAGSFRFSTHAQAHTCLLSTRDVAAETNYVEASFQAAAGRRYRAFAYVGSCCAEVGAFAVQVTDLPKGEPGGPTALSAQAPLGIPAGTVGRGEPGGPTALGAQARGRGKGSKHDRHGGEKAPVWWEWVALPMPGEFKTAGAKRIRILTEHRGFAVACVLVTTAVEAPSEPPRITPQLPDPAALLSPPPPPEKELLAEADRLWADDPDAAIRIYRRLLSEFGATATVGDARTRIRKRAEQGD